MELTVKALFLCAFCIINTNAMFYKDKDGKCGAISDNNMIVYDLQGEFINWFFIYIVAIEIIFYLPIYIITVVSCVFVQISEIEVTGNTLTFIMKNPDLAGFLRMELTKTEQMLISPDTPITFARRGRGDDRDHWNNEETKKLREVIKKFDANRIQI